jgi:short-subunit dehydrogenase
LKLAKQGTQLALIARNTEKLQEVAMKCREA